jgi:hypothetical protein
MMNRSSTRITIGLWTFPGVLLALAGFTLKSSAWEPQHAPVMSPWAQLVDTNCPLPEYPRPQMVRTNWFNLNGVWQFQPGAVGDPVPASQELARQILVPFPMESALSGVMQHYPRSWYRRLFTVPAEWSGQRILLHFGAVDWESEVFINGRSAGVHKGGYDPFSYDITELLSGAGPQELIVRVFDPTDNYGQPRGKQTLHPGGIMYTSCSGIWQTVWLEPVPATRIRDFTLAPDIDAQTLGLTVNVAGPASGISVHAVARADGKVISTISGAPGAALVLPVSNPNLWSPGNPFLYDLYLTLSNTTAVVDSVSSYFGMRKSSLGTTNGFVKMLLNNQFVFQYGTLDQGFWPDGIYTAPTDDALKADIEEHITLGFNMVRKHIKVEPARWYYWADRLGLLVWQDMPSLNSYTGNPQPIDTNQFKLELTRMIETLRNHPSIISWVVFNESQGQHDTVALVNHVKTLDPSRLVNEASGGSDFGSGDILDWHSYPNPSCPASATRAVVCGEFGGVGLPITNHTWAPGWGYVAATNSADLEAKFLDFAYQLSTFVQDQGLSAAVYTEITDVEIELNGFLTYDRKVRKVNPDETRMAIAIASTPVKVTTVVPTSQLTGQAWKYRFNQPSSGWAGTSYNDNTANWTTGNGGFGAGNPPNTAGLVRTTWNTPDIWLRRTFNPGHLTAQQISNLFFSVYHDEDVEIYINGVLAATGAGYRTSYGLMALTEAGRGAIIPNANNVLAVHCRQTGGGQYIDVGLVVRESSVSIPARPVPPRPGNLRAAAGALGISIGWDSVPNATDYKVKRATVSGGPYTDLVLTAPLNAVTDSTVSNGVTYFYVISALNASGESPDSEEIRVTARTPPPPRLVTWFKADSLNGLSSGAPVATWTDASGAGNHAMQANAAQRPTFVSNVMNGQPVVRFSAANNTYLEFPRPVENDFTILCVFRSTQGLNTGTQFYQGAGLVNGEVAAVMNDFGLSLNANGRVLAGTGNPDTTIASAAGFNNGLPHVVTFTRTRGAGALELHVNGVSQGTSTGGKQSLAAPARLVLGAQQTLVHWLTGDIAEMRIFSSALTPAERVAEENALRCKYGLGDGAPPAAPGDVSGSGASRQVLLDWLPSAGATGYDVRWSTSPAGPFTTLATNVVVTTFVHTNATAGATNHYQVTARSPCGVSTDAAATEVYLPMAKLEFGLSGEGVRLQWPAWAEDWTLFSTTNLTPPVAWMPVTNEPASSNGSLSVTLESSAIAEFFHLGIPGARETGFLITW